MSPDTRWNNRDIARGTHMVMDTERHAHNEISVSRWLCKEPRSAQSFVLVKEIQRPWGALEPILDWCKKEITGDWGWQMLEMSSNVTDGRYAFYFDLEQDMCAFVLKWG